MKHTLSVLVEDKPGALSRISNLFARRGYNIESLAVGQTEREGVSRITLRVDCAEHSLEQITKQIHKLVNVLRITELVADEAVERDRVRDGRPSGGSRLLRGACPAVRNQRDGAHRPHRPEPSRQALTAFNHSA